jgi:hypothetical protein
MFPRNEDVVLRLVLLGEDGPTGGFFDEHGSLA